MAQPPLQITTSTTTITLADGRQAHVVGVTDPFAHTQTLSFQIFNTDGTPSGPSQLLAQNQGATSIGADVGLHALVTLSGGGFDLIYQSATRNADGGVSVADHGVSVDAGGHILGENFLADVTQPSTSSAFQTAPLLASLAGDRFAVGYETFDAAGHEISHAALGSAIGGVYADVIVPLPVDVITHGNGDITLQWNNSGVVIREILGEDGSVLATRAASKSFALAADGNVTIDDFDAAHDQLTVMSGARTVAFSPTSTLTFDAQTHTLTWDPDSEGPAAATTVAVLNGVDHLGVANLQDIFRPEVLKNLAADGSSTIQWFDSDNSQTWDTLLASYNTANALTTYAVTNDDGTKTVFNIDADNSQPYSRFVDQEDVTGHILQRTTVVDNGESWSAKYTYAEGQVVSYEVDSFDVGGALVARNFFNPDGTIIAH